jgi:ribosomal protein L11 methyltransferase
MPSHLYALTTTRSLATRIADALAEGETPFFADAAGAFDRGDGTWAVEAWFPEAVDDTDLAEALADLLDAEGLATRAAALALLAHGRIRPLRASDWSGLGLDGLPPIVAGRFRVFGDHNRPTRLGPADLVIEASTAFGSGDHASTQLSLGALDAVLKATTPTRILDLGTGTGILGLALARIHPAARILATDIAPHAVATAERNRRLAGVDRRFRAVLADGVRTRTIRAAAPFDLVLANVLPDPLCRFAGDLVPLIARHGRLIVAGLRVGEQSRLEAAYGDRGLRLEARHAIKEWASLTFVRP